MSDEQKKNDVNYNILENLLRVTKKKKIINLNFYNLIVVEGVFFFRIAKFLNIALSKFILFRIC